MFLLSLYTDDEADDVKKKKKMWINEKEPDTILKAQKTEPQDDGKVGETKKKKIIKRIIRTKQADGTYISREVLITDPKEVTIYFPENQCVMCITIISLTLGKCFCVGGIIFG